MSTYGSGIACAERCHDTVLLVTAEADAESVMHAAIKESSHKLQTAHSMKEAFDAIRREIADIALVIIDLDLEPPAGVALLSALKIANVPTVAVTSLCDPDLSALANRHGALTCFPKPMSPLWVRYAVEQVSERLACVPAAGNKQRLARLWINDGDPH